MSSYIKQPVALNEIGSRNNNEDYIYPVLGSANQSNRLFIVCDGMGGPKKGEVAARLVAENFVKYIESFPPDGELYKGYLDQALISTEETLSAYMKAYPESVGMGTTMAMAYLNGRQAILAWVGNSRVFHYQRSSGKLEVTEATEIESSQDSLMWNPIPQVIHGTETPTQLQLRTIDLAHGDYLFLCTDGILEQVDESVLNTLFSTGAPPEQLIEEIKTLSEGSTQDNYSCYMMQMDLEDEPIPITPLKVAAPVQETEVAEKVADASTSVDSKHNTTSQEKIESSNDKQEEEVDKRKVDIGFVLLMAAGLIALGLVAWNQFSPKKPFDNHLAKGQQLEEKLEYEQAINIYDSAFLTAESADERTMAREYKQKATEAMNKLKPTSAQLTSRGNAAFVQADYAAAVENYEAALAAYSQEGATPADFPHDQLAESYVLLADELYARTDRSKNDEEQVLNWYDKASNIYENPALKVTNDELMKRSLDRAADLEKKLSEGLVAEVSNRGLIQKDNRPTASPETKNANTAKKNIATKPKKTLTKPKTKKTSSPQARKNTTAARSVRPAIKVASTPELQHLADGKALYNKAKTNTASSSYQYRMAAEHLLSAGTQIDGMGAYLLAYMYLQGLGVDQNTENALKHAQKSANLGWPGGSYLYGYCLLKRNNKVDSANAKKSLEKAAAKKYQPAIDLLKKL